MLFPVHPNETGTGYAHNDHLYLIVDVLLDDASHPETQQVSVGLDVCLEVQITPTQLWAEAASSPMLTESPRSYNRHPNRAREIPPPQC
jgi:hypothetical protein